MNRELVAVRTALRGWQAGIWTALPAIVESFDATKRTVKAQPTIQAQVQDPKTGEWQNTTLPVLPDVPVVYPGGGGFLLTFPLQPGDEGVVVFASRCIDAWWQSGGVQPQAENRLHDLSDGMFFPSPMSQSKDVGEIDGSKAQLRNADSTITISITGDGKVEIEAPTEVAVTAPLTTINGNLNVTGNIHADGSITWPGGSINGGVGAEVVITGTITATEDVRAGEGGGDQVNLRSHTHGGVQAGVASSGAPNAGT